MLMLKHHIFAGVLISTIMFLMNFNISFFMKLISILILLLIFAQSVISTRVLILGTASATTFKICKADNKHTATSTHVLFSSG